MPASHDADDPSDWELRKGSTPTLFSRIATEMESWQDGSANRRERGLDPRIRLSNSPDLTHKDGAEPAEFICSSQRIT